jgi:hypothetical protein
MEKIEYRPFSCDKCGCIHSIQTNHKGQVYAQKCKNWPCTSGCFDYTSMTYWGGKTIEKIARARDEYGNIRKLVFKNI